MRGGAGKVVWNSLDQSYRRTLSKGEVALFAACAVAFFAVMVVNKMVLPRPIPDYAAIIAYIVLCMPMWLIAPKLMLRHQSLRVRTALLRAGYCASCGYTLPRHEPGRAGSSDDGLVRCPECGAWWRPTGEPAAPE